MQKVLNVLTVISFGVITIGTAAGVYVYTNRDAIIEGVKSEIMGSVTEMLPVPEIPGVPDVLGGTSTGSGSPVPISLPVSPF